MTEPLSRGIPPADLSKRVNNQPAQSAKDMARTLHCVIKAAVAANLQIDDDMLPEVSQLVRNAVDGLLEAAEIMAKRLARELEMNTGDARQ